jgi:murein L,D-transpeptidase YcbB/YkuD
MKKVFFLIAVCTFLFVSSGCVATKQNTYDINQIKGQMANVESVLSRQNLLIQQNKAEIDALYERNDEFALALANRSNTSSQAVRSAPRSTSPAIGIQSVQPSSDILSDKLVPQPSITQVQTSLRNAGFYIGKIDGKAGPMTRDAISAFQKANGLVTDGIVGRRTWDKLREYL